MTKCVNNGCHREAEHTVAYGFEAGPRISNDLCGPCKDMLIEGSNAVDIEVGR